MNRATTGCFALLIGLLACSDRACAGDAVLVEFASRRCSYCEAMQPLIDQLTTAGVAVRRVDVEREADLARRYGVRETPTYVVISGGRELTRLVGTQSAGQLQEALSISTSGPRVPTAANASDQPRTRLAPLPTAPPSQGAAQHDAAAAAESTADRRGGPEMDAIGRAEAATVRLRVYDGQGHGVGTGTIVDTQGEEALVMTCGHLFRDTQGQGRIEVDVFVDGRSQTIEGQLVDYDADDRDIAVVSIRPGFPIQPVPVIRQGMVPEVGSSAFSFGCDRGDDPSRRDTRVTGVNKYDQHKGASNLEIAGAPVDGRSGGGLFNGDGYLIGVCNAADYQGDIGIYAGPGAVQWQLDRVQLAHLYQHTGRESLAAAGARPAGHDRQGDAPANELIVIVRDPANPHGSSRVMTLNQPSGELMRMIEAQAASRR